METLVRYRELVQHILEEYAAIPYANGEYERELVIDHEKDRYLLLTMGWDGKRRVY